MHRHHPNDPPIELRVARHTQRLDETVAFYRDGIGFPEIGRFRDHAGYDGVFLAIPGADAHLELTTGGSHGVPTPHPESLLVLYLGSSSAVRAIAARLRTSPVPPANPYWTRALTFEDPDGFRVVLVPHCWEPRDGTTAVRIAEHRGSRAELRHLFEFAEDSSRALDAYLDRGRVLVALDDAGVVVGHLQLTDATHVTALEINNMAVESPLRRRGIGRALVEAAVALARNEMRSRLVVATAAADTGNLRFYQRLGFRMRSIERDAFGEAAGYEPGVTIGGIELRDRVWLDRDLT